MFLKYVKESSNFTFEMYHYITKMVEQHVILENLKEYGYQEIDDGTKVQLFLEGITAPGLEVSKTCILLDDGWDNVLGATCGSQRVKPG